MTIQWFPGHMAKARREIEEKLSLVDLVIELLDARAPFSSENPMLKNLIETKPKLVVLMKKDLADPEETKKWLSYFKEEKVPAVALDVQNYKDIQSAINAVQIIGKENIQKLIDKGIQTRPIRAMVVGIPNVGKSTLINRFANRKIAKIGDRPGITRHQLWIKVNKDFELLDTPGVLWPKFEDRLVGLRLAAIGTIKDHLLPLQDVAAFVIEYLQENYPTYLEERYSIDQHMYDMWDIFDAIGRKRGALESGGKVNFDKVANIVLRDLRLGRLGRITLEKTPNDENHI